MPVDPEKVKDLLSQNLPTNVVATAVGCDPSYITQLLSNEDFANDVIAARTLALADNTRRDVAINKIEDKLIQQLDEMVDSGYIRKPRDVLTAFNIVNSARRRGVNNTGSLTLNHTVVNLQIPTRVARKLTINQQGEVVQVDKQTLVTMPSQQLLRNLSESEKDGDRYKEVRGRLLATDTAEARRNDEYEHG